MDYAEWIKKAQLVIKTELKDGTEFELKSLFKQFECRLHRNELCRATVREVLHIRRRIRIISIISPQACGSYKGFSNKSC